MGPPSPLCVRVSLLQVDILLNPAQDLMGDFHRVVLGVVLSYTLTSMLKTEGVLSYIYVHNRRTNESVFVKSLFACVTTHSFTKLFILPFSAWLNKHRASFIIFNWIPVAMTTHRSSSPRRSTVTWQDDGRCASSNIWDVNIVSPM